MSNTEIPHNSSIDPNEFEAKKLISCRLPIGEGGEILGILLGALRPEVNMQTIMNVASLSEQLSESLIEQALPEDQKETVIQLYVKFKDGLSHSAAYTTVEEGKLKYLDPEKDAPITDLDDQIPMQVLLTEEDMDNLNPIIKPDSNYTKRANTTASELMRRILLSEETQIGLREIGLGKILDTTEEERDGLLSLTSHSNTAKAFIAINRAFVLGGGRPRPAFLDYTQGSDSTG